MRRFFTIGMLALLIAGLTCCGATGPGSAGSWRSKGKAALKQGRLGVAAQAFAEDLRANPTDPTPHRWLARTHERRGDFTEALASWNRWLAANPTDWAAWQKVGDLCFATGQYAASLDAFERVVASAIAAPIVIARMAEAEIQLRREGKARKRLEAALKEHTDAPSLYRVYGRVLLAQNHPHKSIVALKKASDLDPSDVTALYDMGRILEGVGFPKRARKAYAAVLSRRSNHVGATVRLGRVLIQLGQPVDALMHLQKAIRMQPDDVSTHNSRHRTGNQRARAGIARLLRRLCRRSDGRYCIGPTGRLDAGRGHTHRRGPHDGSKGRCPGLFERRGRNAIREVPLQTAARLVHGGRVGLYHELVPGSQQQHRHLERKIGHLDPIGRHERRYLV